MKDVLHDIASVLWLPGSVACALWLMILFDGGWNFLFLPLAIIMMPFMLINIVISVAFDVAAWFVYRTSDRKIS